MSLSTHLATIIPSYSQNHFQSAFHDPQHSSPCKALIHTLQKINDGLHPVNDELSEQETKDLFGMFDALRASPVYGTMDIEQQVQLFSDARLALRATNGEPDPAWELVSILLDLERDLSVGIYHSVLTTPLSPTLFSPTPESRPSSPQSATSGSPMTSPINPTPRTTTLVGTGNIFPSGRRMDPTTFPDPSPLMIQTGR